MKKKDYSKEIYDKYFNPKGKPLKIILQDNTILEGRFVGFFHGDTESGEPFIIKWHFIPDEDLDKYHSGLLPEAKQGFGSIIKQEDIKSVTFK
jgi:hypothetical protein